jgi:hypothetical protein
MGNLFFTPHFRWGRFLLACAPLVLSAALLGQWAAFDFFHGSISSVFLIKVLLDAGVLIQKRGSKKSPLRKVN